MEKLSKTLSSNPVRKYNTRKVNKLNHYSIA